MPPPSSITQSSPQGSGNQNSLDLLPGQQIARLRTDLFGGDPSTPAWIELTGDTAEIGTFFQFGTGSLSQLDGGVAITQTSLHFTLTRVFDGPEAFRGQGAVTEISVFNPNDDAVTVALTYLPPNGVASTQGIQPVIREIPARSMIADLPSEMFGSSLSGGTISGEVTAGDGVLAFELIQLTDQPTVLGLNAATGNDGARAYSAQLASQPGLFTSINVVNTADETRNVTLRAIGEDGSSLADPVDQVLQPGEAFTEDAGVLFGGGMAGQSPSGDVNLVGSLVVEADGDGVVGDVIFGDPENFQYAASVPLQTQTFQEALFNQVANIAGFFTGLAFFYPGTTQVATQGVPDAEITIQVFLPSGEMVGQSVQTLAVGQRFSRLVSQLVAKAVNLGGGYVRIFSTQPVIGQMLFGVVTDKGLQLFSAVPPTVTDTGSFCPDLDADGFPDEVCGGSDCNDAVFAINPGAAETCDNLDNDCDVAVDEGVTQACGSDVGACQEGLQTCSAGSFGSCVDELTAIEEVCDGVDNDCDGSVDEDFDADGDTFTTCGGDCDDTNVDVNPDATEVCDGLDNDCDDLVDEDFDGDADTFTTCGGDCDDTNVDVNPDATEVCDGLDNDCDDLVDENASTEVCDNVDNDCDDLVDENASTEVCDNVDNDCDDLVDENASTEVCDNVDNDCDGTVDEGCPSPGECGDGIIDGGEDCDDSGESAVCDTDCTAVTCGDGTFNSSAGEQCDDGGESAVCDTDCTAVTCGDGTVNVSAGEECDAGGESAACDINCTAAVCGDGTLNVSAGEQCDDGGESKTCNADCTLKTL